MSVNKMLAGTVPVVIGIFIAGYAMYSFRNIAIVNDARKGFDAGLL